MLVYEKLYEDKRTGEKYRIVNTKVNGDNGKEILHLEKVDKVSETKENFEKHFVEKYIATVG